MMLLLVVSIVADPLVGSVPRNLFVNNENFSGSWELSDISLDDTSRILLLPTSTGGQSGYAWRLKRSPAAIWSGILSFGVNNRSELLQGGIFLTSEFGLEGRFFGGPPKFLGIAVIFEIQNLQIRIGVHVNNGSRDLSEFPFVPDTTFPLVTNEFTIKIISNLPESFSVSLLVSENETLVYESQPEFGKSWLSVTGVSNITEFSILSANLSFVDEKVALPEEEEVYEGPVNVEFHPESGLTHTEFRRLSAALVAVQENLSLITGMDELFQGILELGRVLNGSAKVRSTQRAIEKILFSYVDSWKRRSFVMISETETLRLSLMGEASSVSFLIEDFRYNVGHEFQELKVGAGEIAERMNAEIAETARYIQSLKNSKALTSGNRLPTFLYMAAVIEVICLLLYATNLLKKSEKIA
jgi:hypothetical protein